VTRQNGLYEPFSRLRGLDQKVWARGIYESIQNVAGPHFLRGWLPNPAAGLCT
jgi:hypothetical protein